MKQIEYIVDEKLNKHDFKLEKEIECDNEVFKIYKCEFCDCYALANGDNQPQKIFRNKIRHKKFQQVHDRFKYIINKNEKICYNNENILKWYFEI